MAGADVEGDAIDRISDLPRNVKDHIIQQIPIRDAARTSILSRKWKNVWVECPCIVLDIDFCRQIMRGRNRLATEFQNDYINIVYGILLQRRLPVSKFVIDISKLSPAKYSHVNKWIDFISRNGVKELRFTAPNAFKALRYRIPRCTFACPELSYLEISGSILKVPNDLRAFCKLTELTLQNCMLEPSILSTPMLVSLILRKCRGVNSFYIQAPELRKLTHVDNDCLELSSYNEFCKDIEYAHISWRSRVGHEGEGEKVVTLNELLGCWSRILMLLFDGFSLKHFAAGVIPERLETTLDNLEYLYVCEISFDLDQIASILCILQSSPNLHELRIQASPVVNNDSEMMDFLLKQSGSMKSIKSLRRFEMRRFTGSEAELLLMKVLLGSCSSLERVFVEENEELDPVLRLGICKALMQFPRASPVAQMTFQPNGF